MFTRRLKNIAHFSSVNLVKSIGIACDPVIFSSPSETINDFVIKLNDNKKYVTKPLYPKYKQLRKIQYCSDIHVDHKKNIPDIIPESDTLIVAGDVGIPTHENFYKFFSMVSDRFSAIYFVPGNHEYGCTKSYDNNLYLKYQPVLEEIINSFNNVKMLNNELIEHENDVVIAGTTLWSQPDVLLDKKSKDHYSEHLKALQFIKLVKMTYPDKKIVIVSHYVPTHSLIEEKYKNHPSSSYFVTDLDKIINNPIHTWICGHTHSVGECDINGVNCLINAHGYNSENKNSIIKTKTFFI